jgi:hypothetical protein
MMKIFWRKKETNMEPLYTMELLYTNEAGVTTKYTEEMLIMALKTRDKFDAENQRLQAINNDDLLKIGKLYDQIATIKGQVFDFFNDEYEPGTESIEFTIDQINQLLESIDSMKLKALFTVSGTITFTICDIEAEDQDAAENEVVDYLAYDYQGSGLVDTFEVEIDSN